MVSPRKAKSLADTLLAVTLSKILYSSSCDADGLINI